MKYIITLIFFFSLVSCKGKCLKSLLMIRGAINLKKRREIMAVRSEFAINLKKMSLCLRKTGHNLTRTMKLVTPYIKKQGQSVTLYPRRVLMI